MMQMSAPISPGSSGGPVFNKSGDVIGIVQLTIRESQNLNFAIPIDYMNSLLVNQKPRKFSTVFSPSNESASNPSTQNNEEGEEVIKPLDGSWTTTFADSLGNGTLLFNLVESA